MRNNYAVNVKELSYWMLFSIHMTLQHSVKSSRQHLVISSSIF